MGLSSRNNHWQSLRTAGLGLFIGFLVIFSTALGYLIGWWLDKEFKTSHILTIIFISLGCAAGFYEAYKISRKYFKK